MEDYIVEKDMVKLLNQEQNELIKGIRNQAIKEFAERLKEYSITEYKEFGALRFYKISYAQLDELVEEMTK